VITCTEADSSRRGFQDAYGLDRCSSGIMGSNPARGVYVCQCFSVLRCPESYQNVWKDSEFQKLILNWNRPEGLIRDTYNNDNNITLENQEFRKEM
jgi:hypothetical protein